MVTSLVPRPKQPPNADHLEYNSWGIRVWFLLDLIGTAKLGNLTVRTPTGTRHGSSIYRAGGTIYLQQGGTRYGCNIWSGGTDYSARDSSGGPVLKEDYPQQAGPRDYTPLPLTSNSYLWTSQQLNCDIPKVPLAPHCIHAVLSIQFNKHCTYAYNLASFPGLPRSLFFGLR